MFYKRVLDRLSHLPGVEHAAAVSELPLSGDRWVDMIRIPGDTRPPMQVPSEHFRWVTPGYFETIHLPLIAGRLLSPSDEGKPYAVISELTARTLWPGKNPVGLPFSRAGMKEAAFTVIGVVGNARTVSLAAAGSDDGLHSILVSQRSHGWTGRAYPSTARDHGG